MKSRRCRSCGQLFATPDSIRTHKRDHVCRTPEVLRIIGWTETPQGWLHPQAPTPKPDRVRRRLRPL